MKPFLELREGDPVWTHPATVSSVGHVDYKALVVSRGTVAKRAGGRLRCTFRYTTVSIAQRVTNAAHENEMMRYLYSEYGNGMYVYSSERAAILGLWALKHRYTLIARMQDAGRAGGEKLLAIAKLLEYEELPEGIDG